MKSLVFFFVLLFFALQPQAFSFASGQPGETGGPFASPSPAPAEGEDSSPASSPASGSESMPPASLPSVSAEAKAPQQTGNPLNAARIIGIVGESVVKARRGWVNLEPGARPAYVGIQGGTAPITLLRTPTGSVLGYTGNTGNDFIQLLQGKEPPKTALPPSDSKEALELPLPPPQDLAGFSASREAPLFTTGPALTPFGLSTPDHVVLQEEAKTPPSPPTPKIVKKKKPKARAKASPLRPDNFKHIYLLSAPAARRAL